MDEGRLKAVRKSQKLHRKFAYAMNDTIRNRQESYQHCLSREEQETNARLVSKVMGMRQAVVRSKVLLQCLNVYRQVPTQPNRARSEPILGKYGGRPIESFSRDIDQRLAWFHPRLRRLRQVDRIKQNCLRQGEILDDETIKEKMEDFFARNLPPVSPAARLSPLQTNPRHHSGTGGDLDEDDFDLRDYPNPIGAANIKLKLHPFGNMVDIPTSGSRRANSPTKWNVFKNSHGSAQNGILKVKRKGSPLKNLKDTSASDVTSMAVGSDLSAQVSVTNLETSSHNISLDHMRNSSSLTKYSNPLPSITPAALSSENPEIHILSQTPKTADKKDVPTQEKTSIVTLRMSQEKRNNGKSSNGVTLSKTNQQEQQEADDRPTLTRRKTLILPPIETSKEMIKKK